jgi:hypothetical protein
LLLELRVALRTPRSFAEICEEHVEWAVALAHCEEPFRSSELGVWVIKRERQFLYYILPIGRAGLGVENEGSHQDLSVAAEPRIYIVNARARRGVTVFIDGELQGEGGSKLINGVTAALAVVFLHVWSLLR